MKTYMKVAAVFLLLATPTTAYAKPSKVRGGGPIVASVGEMPAKYAKADNQWGATVTVDQTRIMVSVDMPERRRGRHIESLAHFDGSKLVLDKPLPAFAALALQGNEDEHIGGHSTLTRTVTVAPTKRVEGTVTTLTVPARVKWVAYKSRKEWLHDHKQIMDADPATRWDGYDATMAARRTATLTPAVVDDFRARVKAQEDAELQEASEEPSAQTPSTTDCRIYPSGHPEGIPVECPPAA